MRSLILLTVSASLIAAEPYIKPGDRYVEIVTPHLRSFVPADQANALSPLLARADAIYAAMSLAAGRPTDRRLDLLLSDELDDHNGFSTVIPVPLVQVQLAPAGPTSSIFDGGDYLERTLIHEFAHHLSNDRNQGFRGVLEKIFGRVLPIDELSLLVFYLSTPAHVTMPRFWHEGLGQWAETEYAPVHSVWGGRGRDPLTHMVWRLDAAANAIPTVGEWRTTRIEWPFGSSVYVYGIAYLRWVEARLDGEQSMWNVVDDQAKRWAFSFNGGSEAILGSDHSNLITRARGDLLAEQNHYLAIIRQAPITESKRLTPLDTSVSAPAWLDNDHLVAALNDPWGHPRVVSVDNHGHLRRTGSTAYARGAIRAADATTFVRNETASGLDAWARSRIEVNVDGQAITLCGERLLQPDAHRQGSHLNITAIRLLPAGMHELVTGSTTVVEGVLSTTSTPITWATFPTEGQPWTPTWSPNANRLAWVETDASGSRLVVAPMSDPSQRNVCWSVPGRILHPVWTRDGSQIICCSDRSGVANAYVITVDGSAEPRAITNTIGGIVACVPSPDGSQFAIVDHDRHGPYLAIISADPTTWASTVPDITCLWPAPMASAQANATGESTPARALAISLDPVVVPSATPYHGLTRIRPLFWTPSTFVAPDGGLGVLGFAADPLMTHQLFVGAGVGAGGYEPVGQIAYSYSGWPIEVGVHAWHTERIYNDLLRDTNGDDHDYVERQGVAEVRAGRGLSGNRRRAFAYAAVGLDAWRTSSRGAEEYEDVTIATGGLFTGNERYVEGVVGYGDTTIYPTSFSSEQGIDLAMVVRRSGFGGDLDRTRVIGLGDAVWSVWPRGGHQIRVGGQVGRSSGDETLQGSFSVGGILGLGLPRGYSTIEQVGTYLIGGSVAYRFPLWRPFDGFNSSPWAHRQVAMEVFYDAAEVSTDDFLGNGQVFASVGLEVHDEWEFYGLVFQPGIGVAQQLDGDEDTTVYLTLGFR